MHRFVVRVALSALVLVLPGVRFRQRPGELRLRVVRIVRCDDSHGQPIRAVRLALCNLLDVRPGAVDRTTLGHPGKLSYCVAEDEANSPWRPLAERVGAPGRKRWIGGGTSRLPNGAGD